MTMSDIDSVPVAVLKGGQGATAPL